MSEKNIILEIGKTYKDNSGRLIKITKGSPPIDGKRDGWNGVGNGIRNEETACC